MQLVIGTERGFHVARWIPGERSAGVEHHGSEESTVSAVARVEETVYCAAAEGLFASEDRGATWERRSGPPDGLPLRALAAGGGRPRVLHAGTEPARLYASRDGGASWSESASFRRLGESEEWRGYGERQPHVRTLVPDPSAARRLYVGVEIGGAYRTDDGGASWRGVNAGLYDDIHVLAADPTVGGRVYAATGGGFYLSRNRGREWSAVPGPLGSAYCTALLVRRVPASGGAWVYLGTAAGPPGTWEGNEHGAGARLHLRRHDDDAWEEVDVRRALPGHHGYSALAADPESETAVFLGTTGGELHYGEPDTPGWSRILYGLPGIRSLAVA